MTIRIDGLDDEQQGALEAVLTSGYGPRPDLTLNGTEIGAVIRLAARAQLEVTRLEAGVVTKSTSIRRQVREIERLTRRIRELNDRLDQVATVCARALAGSGPRSKERALANAIAVVLGSKDED
jgi:hypothetical protein